MIGAATAAAVERYRPALWVIGAASASLVIAFVLASRPWLAAGAVAGGALMITLLLRPRVIIGLQLALGAVDLSMATGGTRALLPGFGGLDMNGIRLLGTVAGLAAVTAVDRDWWRHALGPHARWYLIFLLFAAGTLASSTSPLDGARLLMKLAFPLSIFIAVLGTVRSREDLERYADWVLWGAAAIVLLFNPIYVLSGGYWVGADGSLRVEGVGLHPNAFAFYLTITLLIAFSRFAVRGQYRYLGLCVAIVGWLVLTLTRTTLVASLAGLAGVALYGALVTRNYRALAATAVIAALIAIPLVPAALERTFGYVPTMQELLALAQDPRHLYGVMNWEGRNLYWPIVFSAFRSNPFTGLGLGSTSAVLGQAFPGSGTLVVHNEYLRLLAATGILGVALFAFAVLRWWVAVLRAGRTSDPLVREFALPAFAGILAWAIIAIPGNPFDYYAQFTQYIGFLCAGTLAAAELARAEAEPAEVPS